MANLDSMYSLKLASGRNWCFVATQGTGSWLDKLAAIMQLRPGEKCGSSRVVITARGLEDRRETGETFISSEEQSVTGNYREAGEGTLANPSDVRFYRYDGISHMQYHIVQDENHSKNLIQMWNLIHYICQQEQVYGGFPFHAGLIELNGKGVLLAGSSGVGKSTCCLRIPPPWQALADDQTLVVCEERGQYTAHPLPTWSDLIWEVSERTWNVERNVSLSAIFFLQQAEQDEVIPLDPWKASALVYRSAREMLITGDLGPNKEERWLNRKRLFDNACELAKVIPAYSFKVSRTGEFWKQMEKVL